MKKNATKTTYRLSKGVHISVATEYKKNHEPYQFTKEQLAYRGRKISEAVRGHKVSEKTREKISESLRERRKGVLKWGGYKSQSEWRVKQLENVAGRPRPNICEICSEQRGVMNFDHCHKSNKFRGWICSRCNRTLGMVSDDIVLLEKLIKYLSTHA